MATVSEQNLPKIVNALNSMDEDDLAVLQEQIEELYDVDDISTFAQEAASAWGDIELTEWEEVYAEAMEEILDSLTSRGLVEED